MYLHNIDFTGLVHWHTTLHAHNWDKVPCDAYISTCVPSTHNDAFIGNISILVKNTAFKLIKMILYGTCVIIQF